MSGVTGIKVGIDAQGPEALDVPVRVEVLSAELDVVGERWVSASEQPILEVDPGVYIVRGSLASGRSVQEVVRVQPGEVTPCSLPTYEASPEGRHEWAYMASNVGSSRENDRGAHLLDGLWARLWRRRQGEWAQVPLPHATVHERRGDGVSFSMHLEDGLHLLQVGAAGLPPKFTAVPSTHEVMVLAKPTAGDGAVHPIELVVASTDWHYQVLLSLMQRGDLDAADSLEKSADLAQRAEDMLYAKVRDACAAAIGGYYLLRTGALSRMHDWAGNLTAWFEWLPDGAIIRASQLMRQAKRGDDSPEGDEARSLLLTALDRGVPLYSEGLRRLRDGLLLIDRRSQQTDPTVRGAIERIGRYASAADWSATTTTFCGWHPDEPVEWRGQAESGLESAEESIPRYASPAMDATWLPGPGSEAKYLLDVPIQAAIQSGSISLGSTLVAAADGAEVTLRIEADGSLLSVDGRRFKSLLDLASESKTSTPWHVKGIDMSFDEATKDLRLGD